MSLRAAMSFITFVSTTLAYICVVAMLACPNILDTVSNGISRCKVIVVANVWRAMWKERSNMSNGNEKKAQRNLLVINYFSIFFHMSKTQKSEAY